MVMISAAGQTVRISMRDLRVMGRNTQGVRLANLREGDYLVAIQKVEGANGDGFAEEEENGLEQAKDFNHPITSETEEANHPNGEQT
jgi:DNA gyrase subunit A